MTLISFDLRSIALARISLALIWMSLLNPSSFEIMYRIPDLHFGASCLKTLWNWIQGNEIGIVLISTLKLIEIGDVLGLNQNLIYAFGDALIKWSVSLACWTFLIGYRTHLSILCIVAWIGWLWYQTPEFFLGLNQIVLWLAWITVTLPWGRLFSWDSLKMSLARTGQEGDSDLNQPLKNTQYVFKSLSAYIFLILMIIGIGNEVYNEPSLSPKISTFLILHALGFIILFVFKKPLLRLSILIYLGMISGYALMNNPESILYWIILGVCIPLGMSSEHWTWIRSLCKPTSLDYFYAFYDGECGLTHQSIRILKRLDLYKRGLWLGHTVHPFLPTDLDPLELDKLKKTEGLVIYLPQQNCVYQHTYAWVYLLTLWPKIGSTLFKIAQLSIVHPLFYFFFVLYQKCRHLLKHREFFFASPYQPLETADSGGGHLRTQLVKVLPITHQALYQSKDLGVSKSDLFWKGSGDCLGIILSFTLCFVHWGTPSTLDQLPKSALVLSTPLDWSPLPQNGRITLNSTDHNFNTHLWTLDHPPHLFQSHPTLYHHLLLSTFISSSKILSKTRTTDDPLHKYDLQLIQCLRAHFLRWMRSTRINAVFKHNHHKSRWTFSKETS